MTKPSPHYSIATSDETALVRTAHAELDEISTYLLAHNPFTARTVATRIVQRARLLSSFPFSGPLTAMPGVRSISIVNYPYVVLYTINEDNSEVVILNIRDTARKKPAADDPRAG
jgi:plasmid stabilization system protein ParE